MRGRRLSRPFAPPAALSGPQMTAAAGMPAPSMPAMPHAPARVWRADPLRVVLFVLIVLTVSRANAHFSFLIPLRPLLLLSAAALGFAILNPRYLSHLPWQRVWVARIVIALGVTACLSAVFGISLGGSARHFLEEYSKVLIVAFLVMATLASGRDIHWYIWAYVVASGILVWDALFFFQIQRVSGSEEFYRLSNLYTYDANDLGVVLLVGLALTMYAFQMSRLPGRIVCLVIIVGIGAAIAKTGSRGAFLGLAAVAIGVLVLIDSVSFVKRTLFIALTAASLALTTPTGYWEQMRTMLSLKEDYNWHSTTGRKQVIERGMGYMMSHPVFGVGIGNFPMAEGTLSDLAKNWRPGDIGVRWTAPHNSFLQAGAEMGLVGLALWCALVLGVMWGVTRLGRRLPRAWRTGTFDQRVTYHAARYVPLAAGAFAVSGSFVSFAYMDTMYYLAALSVGLYLVTGAGVRHAASAASHTGRGGSGGRGGVVGPDPNAAPYSAR